MAKRVGRIYEVKHTKGSQKVTGILRQRTGGGKGWTGTKVMYEAPVKLGLKIDDIVEFVPGRVVRKESNRRIMKVTKIIERK
ncbi:hypothetical protein GF371_01650 [Candidatus Woesearchaeota archaeon]|nr:hypothetical protein [Candidatus Woesearchaeota archaeon]